MGKVFSIVRQTYGRNPTDDLKDLDVNTTTGSIFMSVTLQAAVHLGWDFSLNVRSVKNQSSKSVEQLFRTTEKLIKNQVEIAWLSTIAWDQPVWKELSLLCDRAVRIINSRTYVFSDSVLCLGGISPEPVQAWRRHNEMLCGETLSQRMESNRRRTDEIWVEKFPRIHHIGNSIWDSKDWWHNLVWTCAISRKDHLHVHVQWHCMRRTRKQRKLYGEFCQCCSICKKFPPGCSSFLGLGCEKNWHGTREACVRRNKSRDFKFLELISRFEFEFRRRGKFFWRIRIFGVFKVQPHAMRLYMCMCCGLFAPTQFHFEYCCVLDNSW